MLDLQTTTVVTTIVITENVENAENVQEVMRQISMELNFVEDFVVEEEEIMIRGKDLLSSWHLDQRQTMTTNLRAKQIGVLGLAIETLETVVEEDGVPVEAGEGRLLVVADVEMLRGRKTHATMKKIRTRKRLLMDGILHQRLPNQ